MINKKHLEIIDPEMITNGLIVEEISSPTEPAANNAAKIVLTKLTPIKIIAFSYFSLMAESKDKTDNATLAIANKIAAIP